MSSRSIGCWLQMLRQHSNFHAPASLPASCIGTGDKGHDCNSSTTAVQPHAATPLVLIHNN